MQLVEISTLSDLCPLLDSATVHLLKASSFPSLFPRFCGALASNFTASIHVAAPCLLSID
jgi:hypothetical protein